MAWVAQAVQSAEQHSERMSGGLLGGYKEVSTSDQEVTEAANFAAEQLSQRSNSLYPFKVKEVRLYSQLMHHQGLAGCTGAPGMSTVRYLVCCTSGGHELLAAESVDDSAAPVC